MAIIKYILTAGGSIVGFIIVAGCIIYFFFPGVIVNVPVAAAAWLNNIKTKMVKTDLHVWPYYEGGRSNQETIIFVHGYGAKRHDWINQLVFFCKDYHVFAPDLPGFGDAVIHNKLPYDIVSGGEENLLGDRLNKIISPTLVLWGQKDRIFDISTVEVIEKAVPDCKIIIFQEAGHVCF
jgi:pimeloyl-ACP methyl ester carboxylesterase